MDSQITLQTSQQTKPTDTFTGTGDILIGIPPYQKVQAQYQNLKQKTNPTSLTIPQILSMTEKDIQEDIFTGVRKSKVIDAYRQIETAIHNDKKNKNKYNTFILNSNTLADIGIYAEVNYSENNSRSFIQLKPYEIDMDILMKYFADRLVRDCVC